MRNKKSLRWISEQYFDQNGVHYQTLPKPPTPLEFSRLVHISRPVLIKGVQVAEDLARLWTNDYLIERMGGQPISVAVTPNGRADAVTSHDGADYFVEPLAEQMTMSELVDSLSTASSAGSDIHYLQSQNGNVYRSRSTCLEASISEFDTLKRDVPEEIPWCSEALGLPPDAVNLWIGDSRSVTSVHSDPYENIYCVIRGKKIFTLFPPCEGWLLEEREYPHAAYTRPPPSADLQITPSGQTVRWSSIQEPGENPPSGTHPIQIEVEAGDTLYLPAGWWHHVRQSGPTVIALNWWYDMEMSGLSWVVLSFLRGMHLEGDGETEDDKP